ncbi:hypothetical protein SEUCBS139899_004224 [Sporothrix eucalyptigena]
MAAVAADDVVALRALLDQHFPDRTEKFQGDYVVSELYPVYTSKPAGHSPRFADFMAEDALDAGNKETLLWLLKQGWNINKVKKRPAYVDDTPLSRAVASAPPTPPNLIRELIDHHGGDVRRDQLLHWALKRKPGDDMTEVLNLLLDRGAPLNATMFAGDAGSLRNYRSSDLGTPLHTAAEMGQTEAMWCLLSQGADASVCSTGGRTALQWAERARKDDAVAILQSPEQFT